MQWDIYPVTTIPVRRLVDTRYKSRNEKTKCHDPEAGVTGFTDSLPGPMILVAHE